MAKKIADFLKTLIVKAGGNVEDETIKTALAAVSSELEMPDELVTTIDNGLLSIATAKNNHPEIKNHYFGLAYNGLDSELERLITDEKLPDEITTELKAEKSSTKRAVLLARKIKELEGKKANAGKGEKDELAQKIADLNNQLRTEKDSIAGIKQDYENKLRDKDKSYALRGILGSYKTIHDELDPETKAIILDAIIKKNLAAKKAKLTVNDGGELILTGEDGTTNIFSDDNRLLTPKLFLDKVMADEKILKVSDGQQNSGQQQNNFNGQQRQQSHNNGSYQNGQQQNQNGAPKGSAVLRELTQSALRDLEASNGASSIL